MSFQFVFFLLMGILHIFLDFYRVTYGERYGSIFLFLSILLNCQYVLISHFLLPLFAGML